MLGGGDILRQITLNWNLSQKLRKIVPAMHTASLRNGLRVQAQTRPAKVTPLERFCVSPMSITGIDLIVYWEAKRQ